MAGPIAVPYTNTFDTGIGAELTLVTGTKTTQTTPTGVVKFAIANNGANEGDGGSSLTGTVTGSGDFTVSARIRTSNDSALNEFDFTGAEPGVFAYSSGNPRDFGDGNGGYQLIIGSGFSDSNHQAIIINGSTKIAQINGLDLTTTDFDVMDVTLTLTGTFNGLGGLDLNGVVFNNNTSLVAANLNATVATPNQTGSDFGIIHRAFGGGAFTASYDDLSINVVPEPGSIALLSIGGLALLARKRS